MLGNARNGEGEDEITAPRNVYDARQGRVKAGAQTDAENSQTPATSEPDKPERVRITITPKKR